MPLKGYNVQKQHQIVFHGNRYRKQRCDACSTFVLTKVENLLIASNVNLQLAAYLAQKDLITFQPPVVKKFVFNVSFS